MVVDRGQETTSGQCEFLSVRYRRGLGGCGQWKDDELGVRAPVPLLINRRALGPPLRTTLQVGRCLEAYNESSRQPVRPTVAPKLALSLTPPLCHSQDREGYALLP